MQQSLGSALSARRNSLNFVRLVLACAVILGHTTLIGGYRPNALTDVSSIAVDGFFVLSGFLVAGSRMRLSGGRYLWHRVIRIMPAFWVSLVLVALAFSPLAAAISRESWQPSSALHFLSANWALTIKQRGIGATLQDVPFAGAWNGSLWTLEFEFMAYLLAGLLLASAIVRRHLKVVVVVLTMITAAGAALAGPLEATSYYGFNAAHLFAGFAAGMALWAFRDTLPRNATITGMCGALSVVLYFQAPTLMYALAPLPLGYFLLSVGGSKRVLLGSVNDISYGAYIYAFPVQQLLVVLGVHRLGYAALFVTALALTLCLAWLSWTFVERPALRLKNLSVARNNSRRRSPFEAPDWSHARS
ncbi:membrane hypothetical protein [metagenome]|uniref:Acyltransferase 3 domain-containing protein n=1 Tax=metagenome TaxID=256318 RepID=A0A2P2C1V5_9ZZZZ